MSTRAVYTFKDSAKASDAYHVYKHHDGYPSGAAEWISAALKNAWALPRFEADEFGAAFIAVNKEGSGGVRLTHGYTSHGDLEYRYEVTCKSGVIQVVAYHVDYGDSPDFSAPLKWKQIFAGTLAQFQKFANTENAEG